MIKIKKPKRLMLKGVHSNKHPELQKGEILLANGVDWNYNKLKWKTKRKGKIAYSILHLHRRVRIKIDSLFPVFIKQSELEEYHDR